MEKNSIGCSAEIIVENAKSPARGVTPMALPSSHFCITSNKVSSLRDFEIKVGVTLPGVKTPG
jgi:hypothetical protein